MNRFIDLDKVLGVQEVSDAQQDKNHTTFTVQCDGRTFQLQAHDEPSMRRYESVCVHIVCLFRLLNLNCGIDGWRPLHT